MRRSSVAQLLNVTLIVLFAIIVPKSAARTFNCSGSVTCHALIDYSIPNDTSLSQLGSLFGLKNLRPLLAANNLSISTPSHLTLPANRTVRIPFTCRCARGSGTSDGYPVYRVRKDDFLYHIANDIFRSLVTVEDIVVANKIPDPSLIDIGQKLRIPLPCSCDRVEGSDVLHYGHLVEPLRTVEGIAKEYGVAEATLLRRNGITDPKNLKAYDVLDVPLRACSSKLRRDSPDYPLLIPNGTSMLTAGDCVTCSCHAANNWELTCEPSKLQASGNGSALCPPARCDGVGAANLLLGESQQSGDCSQSCTYAGYASNGSVQVSLSNSSACTTSNSVSSYAVKPSLQVSAWYLLLIGIPSVLLCICEGPLVLL